MKNWFIMLALILMPSAVYAKDIGSFHHTPVTERSILGASDYYWNDVSSDDPVSVDVNLTTQMAYVYRGDILIGATNVSSGRPGFDTPTGVFKILGKEDNHHSKHYDADMPFTMWLNNEGVALHSGGTPGRPSSHGCVHLPLAFAQLLYNVANTGMIVKVSYGALYSGLNLTF